MLWLTFKQLAHRRQLLIRIIQQRLQLNTVVNLTTWQNYN